MLLQFNLPINISEGLIYLVVLAVISLVINGIFLGIALGFVDGKNRDLGDTFVTALFMAIVILIPCIGCILQWWVIKSRHEIGWGKAITAWIMTFVIEIVVFAVVAILFLGGLSVLWSLIPISP
ncbi:MAG: hypothetical protein GF309_01595 [Candidatus Lokiarchaeota archaeon]|nr:hypothetical protein [Candidatus Lokiarchaeota archaeon]